MASPDQKVFQNSPFSEREAIREFKSDVDIVIREADKGSSVLIMDKVRYTKRAIDNLMIMPCIAKLTPPVFPILKRRLLLYFGNVLFRILLLKILRTLPPPAIPMLHAFTSFPNYIKLMPPIFLLFPVVVPLQRVFLS